jgi:hypothetical protein
MTTTATPPGLIRFQKAIPTKRPGKCFFCGTATKPGTDYAALDGGWVAVCSVHAHSVVEQCKALLLLIQSEAQALNLTADDLAKVNEYAPANVADVLAGNVDLAESIAAAIKLSDALRVVRAHQPVARTNVRSNRYEGKCGTCGSTVAEGSGRIEKVNNKWVTYHLDGDCVQFLIGTTTPVATVAEGRYALQTDEGVKFYRVEHGTVGGRWEGFVFVSAQASDDLHPIRNRTTRQAILDAIAADPQAATVLYGKELGVCGRCGATLTSEWREQGIGPVCSTKAW